MLCVLATDLSKGGRAPEAAEAVKSCYGVAAWAGISVRPGWEVGTRR